VVTDSAYETCLRLARSHYENFPVASRLLPPKSRPHIAAIYAFARTADDFADEGDRSPNERLILLDAWQRRLEDAAQGRAADDGSEHSRIFLALASTIRTCDLPVELLEDLLSAFRQDVIVKRYERWEDVLDYCRRSADPVGRLVLRVCGFRAPDLDAQSDAICTALQLTNFWQDFARDWANGRLYAPLDLVASHQASLADLDKGVMSPAWRALLSDVAGRTRGLFDAGRGLADRVEGRLKWELRATILGGERVLDAVGHADSNVFQRRPMLGARDAIAIAWRTMTWRR
jgi:squalene synthase HpnC